MDDAGQEDQAVGERVTARLAHSFPWRPLARVRITLRLHNLDASSASPSQAAARIRLLQVQFGPNVWTTAFASSPVVGNLPCSIRALRSVPAEIKALHTTNVDRKNVYDNIFQTKQGMGCRVKAISGMAWCLVWDW